ncbi:MULTISPECIES: MATE family efflux transporter [Streptomyces]|uniref:MATE family efflux transporter n=1 Tax=Streptomyces TaxID=1883 RepID=UPI001E381E87|nr:MULTISPECIES: MATE family efflux transporter [Streptomyces]UFQ19069.1 MATE family efflux transporter [Streptomyces huasconensis]WCL88688.1 MATE family efflux transporter [Streptomyces sp. JCM 35825]
MTAPPDQSAPPAKRRPVMARLDPARLLPVAWPVYIELMSGVIAGIISVVWIAKLGASALATVTMASTLENVLTSVILAVSGGTTIVLSGAVGANEYGRLRSVLRAALRLTTLVTAVICVVLFVLREPLARLILGSGETAAVQLSVDYLAVAVPGIAVFYGQHLVDSTFKANGDTRTPMRMAILSNLILVVVDPILIYGWLGAPRLGVTGAAVALVASRAITLTVTLWLYRTSALRRQMQAAPDAPASTGPDPVREILKTGLPLGVDFLVRMAAGMLIVGVVARFGTDQVAAYGTVTRTLLFLTMAAYALRQAATIIAAQATGAADDELLAHSRTSSVRLGIAWSLVGGLAVLTLGGLAVDAVTSEAAIRAAAYDQIPWLAVYITLLLCNVTLSGIFLGGGHGKMLAASTTVGAALQLCLAPLLALTPLGLVGAWIAMIINAGTQTAVLLVLASRQTRKVKEVTA